MTNHQPVDARPSAWVGAHERIIAAQKLKMDPDRKGLIADPLPEIYWATLAEAAVLADMARAPGAVGFAAGAHFAGRAERIVENNRQMEELLRRTAGRRKPTRPRPPMPDYQEQFASPADVGHHVRVTRGNWARCEGTVTEVRAGTEPLMLDVKLVGVAAEPVHISVPAADVALVPAPVDVHDHAIGGE